MNMAAGLTSHGTSPVRMYLSHPLFTRPEEVGAHENVLISCSAIPTAPGVAFAVAIPIAPGFIFNRFE